MPANFSQLTGLHSGLKQHNDPASRGVRLANHSSSQQVASVGGRCKIVLAHLVFLLVSLHAVSPALSADFTAQASCAPYRDRALSAAAQSMCEDRLLEAFAMLTNQTFRLGKPLKIVGTQCGQINAYYDRGKSAIFVCYELLNNIVDRITREKRTDPNALGPISAGALSFVFLHELGHALIDHFNLPVLGREEDAADQIATFILVGLASNSADIARYWPVGAHWFFNNRPTLFLRHNFSDQHSVNPQRQFNIACWVYGSNPMKYAGLAKYARLPDSRAQLCEGEYQQLLNAAKQMLSPHLVQSTRANLSGTTPDPNVAEPSPPPVHQDAGQAQGPTMAQKAATCHYLAHIKNLSGEERQNFVSDCYRANRVVVRQ